MARLVAFGAVLAVFSLSHTAAQQSGTVVVDDGRVGIGVITGGKFGPQSFSIGASPGGAPRSEEPDNSEGFNNGNTQLYPVKSLPDNNPGQGGNGGKRRNEGGQTVIGAVIPNDNKRTKNNKKKNGSKQLALDAAAIEAIFGSNGENTGLASTDSSNTGTHGNILMPSITGDNFGEENMNIKDNWKPNVLLKGSVNNENTGNANAGNQEPESKGAKNNGASKTNSGYNTDPSDERWIWSR
ncbi:hypothetical protein PYW07_006914 [Mythimna separata]|uniref:Uncharacterized protein n=1 Tax=Mythimna separata TaxID=271217 RepID=A0AAD8DZH8_MYTSE|nr:hypothetical protein PYW07_006914 [Mythimna separata]